MVKASAYCNRNRSDEEAKTPSAVRSRRLLLLAWLSMAFALAFCFIPSQAWADSDSGSREFDVSGDFTHDLQAKGQNYNLPDSDDANFYLWDLEIDDYYQALIAKDEAEGARILDDYAEGKVIFLAGGVDSATELMVEQFQQFMDLPGFEDIDLVVMHIDRTNVFDSFKEEFQPYCSARIRCVSNRYPASVAYAEWVSSIYQKFDSDWTLQGDTAAEVARVFATEVERPVCIYMEDGVIKALSTGDVSLAAWAGEAFDLPVWIELGVKGGYDSDAAYELLASANDVYEGTGTLRWDSELEEIAKALAAQWAFADRDELTFGEMASGSRVEDLFQGRLEGSYLQVIWRERYKDSPPVISQISEDVTAFAAACYTGADDKDCWVLVTANPDGGGNGARADTLGGIIVRSLKYNVQLNIPEAEVLDSFGAEFYVGNEIELTARSYLAPLRDYEVSWTSSDEKVATVDDEGIVTMVGVGTTTITASLNDDPSINVTWDLEVIPRDIGDATVTLPCDSYEETGGEIKPVPAVEYAGMKLVAGTDYTVSYEGNIKPGWATITIKGRGNYTGMVESGFKIVAKSSSGPGSGSGSSSGGSGSSGGSCASGGSSSSPGTSGATGGGSAVYIGAAKWKRLAGGTALDTMAAIVNEGGFAKGGTVVLATSEGYWDALTAAGIAGMAEAPVLMTDGSTLSSQTRQLIAQLAPELIIVCGGTAAVSDSVAKTAAQAAGGADVVRCAGATATGTACEIFKKAASATGGEWSSTAFVCTSDGYWDALAAAPISYAKGMPIFLTEGASAISSETLSAMKAGGVETVYIVGGTTAIKPAVESQLKATGFKVAGRLWGATAVETSENVAGFGLKLGMSANLMGVATTNGYWDALAGAALCGKNGSVLVLVTDAKAHSISGFVKSHASQIGQGYIFGGTAAIPSAVADALSAASTYTSKLKAASLS